MLWFLFSMYKFGGHPQEPIGIYCAMMGLTFGFAWIYNRYLTNESKDQIDKVNDTRFVGPLIEMVSFTGRLKMGEKVHGAATNALIRLLPRLTQADSVLLSDSHRKTL